MRPRPWLTPEGTINYQILYQLLTSLVGTINKHQTIKQKELHRHFSMVYSPVALSQLVKVISSSDIIIGLYGNALLPKYMIVCYFN